MYDLKESWCEGDTEDADTWEPWALNADLFEQIVDYYEQNPQTHMQIVRCNVVVE